MKFDYEYRTSDNVLQRSTIVAPNRDEAFRALKSQGIRPSRVTEAPGILNKLLGKGKRWIAIVVLAAIAAVSLAIALTTKKELDAVVATMDDISRRQVIGDEFQIQMGIKCGWTNVFEHVGEQFLSGFAVPGAAVAVKTTTEDELKASLDRKVNTLESDSMEVRQIKAMVEGLKQELREYIHDGGTIPKYCTRLVRRQETEIALYQQLKAQLDQATADHMPRKDLERMWENSNQRLRAKGIRILMMPE